MVASPPYACQLVLVRKLTAVLNDRSGGTAGMPCGFKPNQPCARMSTYSVMNPAKLNASMAAAYRCQVISAAGSIPQSR